MVDDRGAKIGVETLFELSGASREAKAYAFLYAAFRKTEVSKDPVRDALDCLKPFMLPYLKSITGKQVQVDSIKTYLRESFGFDIPLYSLEQLLPELQRTGAVTYSKVARAHIAGTIDNSFSVAKGEIEVEFDEITVELTRYAASVGYPSAPPSGGWAEALIGFLKTRTDPPTNAFVKVRGALLDAPKAANAVVGNFIKNLPVRNPDLFDKVLNVFMGVLVEEFISSVAEVGSVQRGDRVNVFYDTAVLLRLLGSSGKMLKTATDELNRYLQDLGFNIFYLGGNEAEVANILNTIVFVKDSGRELEGETAEAIAAGEVSMTDIRMLQNSFPERLAALNVFPANAQEQSAQANAQYQIDERGFAGYLLAQANAAKRPYGVQNRENDSHYLGTVVRLRRKLNTRDLMQCGYIFVTTNKFLANISRRYLIEQRVISAQHCPPILSVGQITTIAWLMKDHKLAPEKAGKELLANCFAAVRPDAEWFKYFREGMSKVVDGGDEALSTDGNILTLQAARRIAQEESFGSSALVRELNMAEILSRAAAETERISAERSAETARIQDAAERDRYAANARYQEELEVLSREHTKAIAEAEDSARTQTLNQMKLESRLTISRRVRRMVYAAKWLLVVSFLIVTAISIFLQLQQSASVALWTVSVVLGLVSVLAFMDLLRIGIASRLTTKVESSLVDFFSKWTP